jgi:aryl-alcohol dehydrogenase-like predicted oxidoreductase
MACDWNKVELGGTGLRVSPMGLAASYGASASDVKLAFERGLNYFYWGSARTAGFGEGLRDLGRKHRAEMVIVVQSYARLGSLVGWSLDRALRKLDTDYADILLLGWWNHLPPERILNAAQRLREQGKIKAVQISSHNRKAFALFAEQPAIDAIMVRYNAAHAGAETEVFPSLTGHKLGVVGYTATRWGGLLDPAFTPAGARTPTASDCYRFVLSHPQVNVVMTGPRNTQQLQEAMSALDKGPMDPQELQWMRQVGRNVRSRNKLSSRLAD